jgi:hypothetical protein
MYACLFEKVLDLESRSIRTMCVYYLHEKYDNSILTYLGHLKIPLHKIESIEIYFFPLIFFI